ncbi:hypothetical protein [Thiocystis violacea]|uniref:hypothetical protein n=1 Tax=Thiocystis violacea TaxID=13725 RepID=UPI0019039320|nr:hypothetical protein [Thiocystis violacea]MBK1717124.1 hypothetical protein [Thiocystis violacea]
MLFDVDEATRKQAKSPHELAMVNLVIFNLLIGVGLLAGSMAPPDSTIARFKWIAVLAPLAGSLVLIVFTHWRARRGARRSSWFVAAHWRLAASRYRLLLVAYLVCAAILSLALFGGGVGGRSEARIRDLPPVMQEMERHKLESQDMGGAVWARIGVVPLLLAIMVSIMLESGSIYQAGRGELPDALVARFPPPPDLAELREAG